MAMFFMTGQAWAQPPTYSGGSGTEQAPYEIATFDDLKALSEYSDHWNAHFLQTADIDASATAEEGYNDGAGWSPIGGWVEGSLNDFKGTYDGGNHIIDGLFINPVDSGSGLGLFGWVAGATIRNLGVTNVHITSAGNNNVGALVGTVRPIEDYSTGTIVRRSTIEQCFSTGTVVGRNSVGGLVGTVRYSTVRNSFSRVAVTGRYSVGGFVGILFNGAIIENSYSTGLVSTVVDPDTTAWGGFAGLIDAPADPPTVTGCFFDRETSGDPEFDNHGAVGKSSAEMKQSSTFTEPVGVHWDFNAIWDMSSAHVNDDYPILQWTNFASQAPSEVGGVYQIETLGHLLWIREGGTGSQRWGFDYRMTTNIDAWITRSWNGGTGWSPILWFNGHFDGNGFAVQNLFINRKQRSGVGLFGQLNEAGTITNLTLENVDVAGMNAVGALVGSAAGTIENCTVLGGTVRGVYTCDDPTDTDACQTGLDVGGLVGVVLGLGFDEGRILDSSVHDLTVSGSRLVGGLAGWIEGGEMEGCTVAGGTVTGYLDVGGLVGTLDKGGRISGSSSSADVTGLEGPEGGGESVGGLVGQTYKFGAEFDPCVIEESSASGDVVGINWVGGLVGSNADETIILRSYATGDVSGVFGVGGLVGLNIEDARIDDCYAAGSVTGYKHVGGLVGINGLKEGEDELPGLVFNSYATGEVTGDDQETTGTLAGSQGIEVSGDDLVPADVGEIYDSFWDSEINPGLTGIGFGDDSGATGKTTAEMKDEATFTDAGWNFDAVWGISAAFNNGYPHLLWSFTVYEIENWEQLHNIRDHLDKFFVLIADLDENTDGYDDYASSNANNGKGWEPIGNGTQPFSGSLNGDQHSISGLYINCSDTEYTGLFGRIDGAMIHNLEIKDASVTVDAEDDYVAMVGILAGSAENFNIHDVTISDGSIDAESNYSDDVSGLPAVSAVGGLIGHGLADVSLVNVEVVNLKINIKSTSSDNNVEQIGGMIGFATDDWVVSNASSEADIEIISGNRAQHTGIFVGEAGSGWKVTDSEAKGDINISAAFRVLSIGIFAGNPGDNWEITDSRAEGDITIGTEENAARVAIFTGDPGADWTMANSSAEGEIHIYAQSDVERIAVFAGNPSAGWSVTDAWAKGNIHIEAYEDVSRVAVLVAYPRSGWLVKDSWAEGEIKINAGEDVDRVAIFAAEIPGVPDPWEVANFRAKGNIDITAGYDVDRIGIFAGRIGSLPWTQENLETTGDIHITAGGRIQEIAIFAGSMTRSRAAWVIESLHTKGDIIINSTGDASDADRMRGIGGFIGMTRTSITSGAESVRGVLQDISAQGNITLNTQPDVVFEGVGGLIGMFDRSTIKNAVADVSINAGNRLGGLVGSISQDAVIESSFALGSVQGNNEVGGLVGYFGEDGQSKILNSYALGLVQGNAMVGGLVGYNNMVTIKKSYAAGPVSGLNDVGGLVGVNVDGTVADSFWDMESSGQATSSGGTGMSTAEMKDIATYSDTSTEGLDAEWAIVQGWTTPNADIWGICPGPNSGSPFLLWQFDSDPCPPTSIVSASSSPLGAGEVSGSGTYVHGSNVTIEAFANPGYVFTHWTEGNRIVSCDKQYSFTVTANRNLKANFSQKLSQYNITASPSPENYGTVTGSGSYSHGANVTMSVQPNQGFALTNWIETWPGLTGYCVVSTDEQYSFAVTRDRNLTANIHPKTLPGVLMLLLDDEE